MNNSDDDRLSKLLRATEAKSDTVFDDNGRLTYLHLYNGLLAAGTDLTGFDMLDDLFIYACGLTDMRTLKLPGSLKKLTVNGNFDEFDCTSCEGLESLFLMDSSGNNFRFPATLKSLVIDGVTEHLPSDYSGLPRLTDIAFLHNELASMAGFKLPPSIETIRLQFNPIAAADFTQCPHLKTLETHTTEFPSLRALTLPPSVENISIYYNEHFTDPDASFIPGLVKYSADWCAVEKVIPSQIPHTVAELSFFGDNALADIEIADLPKLFLLRVCETAIRTITLTNLPKLKSLYLINNKKLTTQDIAGFPELDFIDMRWSPLQHLLLKDLPKLAKCVILGNRFTDFKVENCNPACVFEKN